VQGQRRCILLKHALLHSAIRHVWWRWWRCLGLPEDVLQHLLHTMHALLLGHATIQLLAIRREGIRLVCDCADFQRVWGREDVRACAEDVCLLEHARQL